MNTPSAALSRMLRMFFLLATLAVALQSAPVLAQAQSRGELLYTTHCIACHSEQMHWREKKLANDWPSLRVQVKRWQGVAQLQWTDDDIEGVARYLNERFYGFPRAAGQLSLASQRQPR